MIPGKLPQDDLDLGDDCPQCEHVFDLHAVVALANPTEGGVVICHIQDCLCAATWSAPQVGPADVRMPDDITLTAIRNVVWGRA